MLVGEKFLWSLVLKYRKHRVYTDGGIWCPEACNVLGLKYYLHSFREKSDGKSQPVFKDRNDVSMTTIHAFKMNAIYYMYKAGYNSLYPCTMIWNLRIISYWIKRKEWGYLNLTQY
jgi:hypothetical protein